MALDVHNLFEAKQRKYGTTGVSFTQDFLDAINSVTNDINEQLGTSFEAVTSTDGEIDCTALQYQSLYSQGIDYWMSDNGHWQVDDVAVLKSKYDGTLNNRKMRYQVEQSLTTKLGDLS